MHRWSSNVGHRHPCRSIPVWLHQDATLPVPTYLRFVNSRTQHNHRNYQGMMDHSSCTEDVPLSMKLTAASGALAGVKTKVPIATRQAETTKNQYEFTDEGDCETCSRISGLAHGFQVFKFKSMLVPHWKPANLAQSVLSTKGSVNPSEARLHFFLVCLVARLCRKHGLLEDPL